MFAKLKLARIVFGFNGIVIAFDTDDSDDG
jgi:hypothetical protein